MSAEEPQEPGRWAVVDAVGIALAFIDGTREDAAAAAASEPGAVLLRDVTQADPPVQLGAVYSRAIRDWIAPPTEETP